MNLKRFFQSSVPFAGLKSEVPSTNQDPLVEANTAFALDLYSLLRGDPGNLFFSPFSISTCLTLAYAGARNDTEREMARVLHFDQAQQELHASIGRFQRQLNELGKAVPSSIGRPPALMSDIDLRIANALWKQRGHPFLQSFLDIAQREYQANVNEADFTTTAGADAAIQEINCWVSDRTLHKIRNILPPGGLDPATGLVLANAIYFNGPWAKPFEVYQTATLPFHLSNGGQVDAMLMHHTDTVNYLEADGLQAVEIPYLHNELSMVILLPRKVDGCAGLETQLTPGFLSSTLSQMKKREAELFIPRIKLESTFNLNSALQRMGMTGAFVFRAADFSGLDGTKLLYISGVFHRARLDVCETGTEAAAATTMVIALGKYVEEEKRQPPPVFRADHPFIFLIRDRRSGTLLFLGRLVNPSN